jgi:hypothetical protein
LIQVDQDDGQLNGNTEKDQDKIKIKEEPSFTEPPLDFDF